MAKVDDYVASIKGAPERPETELPGGVSLICNRDGDLHIDDAFSLVVPRDDLRDMVDWIIDVYGITPTGFEKKGGA